MLAKVPRDDGAKRIGGGRSASRFDGASNSRCCQSKQRKRVLEHHDLNECGLTNKDFKNKDV